LDSQRAEGISVDQDRIFPLASIFNSSPSMAPDVVSEDKYTAIMGGRPVDMDFSADIDWVSLAHSLSVTHWRTITHSLRTETVTADFWIENA